MDLVPHWDSPTSRVTYVNGLYRHQSCTEWAEQNGWHFADDISKYIFFQEKFCNLIQISFAESFDLGNGLAPHEWQAVICPNDNQVWDAKWCH